MIEKYIEKALECSRLHSKLVDGIMNGETTENKISELIDQEKLPFQSAWDCVQPFEVRDIVAQQQETINRQKEEITKNKNFIEAAENLIDALKKEIESLIAGQETLQKYIAEKDAEIERLKSPVLAINNFGLSDEEFKEKIKNIPTQIIVYNEEQIKSEAAKSLRRG